MGKLNLNLHFNALDVLKHILRIVFSIIAILLFNKYFPQNLLPKDFIFKTAIYACIYVLVSIILEMVFKKFDNGED